MEARWGNRVGAALLAAWAAWVLVSCAVHGQPLWEAWPYFTTPAFTILGIAAGRRLLPMVAPERLGAVLLLITGYVLLSVAFRGGAGGGPLGYANANAALGSLLTALAAISALHLSGRARRWAVTATVMAAASVPFTLSRAAMALLVPLVAAILLAAHSPNPRRRWTVPASAGIVVLAGSAITYLATLEHWPAPLTKAFSGARHELWADALALWRLAPVTGSGPGSFRLFSALAWDPDTARAHMSFLQVGSELGWVGVMLFTCLVATGLVAVGGSRPADALVGCAALSVLLIHSFVDHLLEFPVVALAAGVVMGLATAPRRADRSGTAGIWSAQEPARNHAPAVRECLGLRYAALSSCGGRPAGDAG